MRLSQIHSLVLGTLGILLLGYGLLTVFLRDMGKLHREEAQGDTFVSRAVVPAAEAWPDSGVWAAPQEAEDSERVSRYELAGTFQVYRTEGGDVESAAVVDDRENGSQRIVREGDLLGAFLVDSITEDQMVLQKQGRDWVLSLTGVVLATTSTGETEEITPPSDPYDLPALETTRFGKRVKENYWILQRDAVKGYMNEMMESQNAIRAINLYRSFSQVSNDEEVGPGFQIGMKGEKKFFRDMGLQDGDIIRKVNSMKMRTQRRAEYLMREFYKDNMSAVVLDVERDGEIQQHIYLVR